MSSFHGSSSGSNTISRERSGSRLEDWQSFDRLGLRYGPVHEADLPSLARAGARYCEEYQKQCQSLGDEDNYEVISRYDLNTHEQHICRRLDAHGNVIEQQSSVRESSHREQRVFIRRGPASPGLHEIV